MNKYVSVRELKRKIRENVYSIENDYGFPDDGMSDVDIFKTIDECKKVDIEEGKQLCEAMKIVQKWSDEHPQNTILMDFVKKYPNAPLEENGTPRFCPYDLGYMTKEDCYMTKKEDFDDCSQYCKQCWSTPIESEVE